MPLTAIGPIDEANWNETDLMKLNGRINFNLKIIPFHAVAILQLLLVNGEP